MLTVDHNAKYFFRVLHYSRHCIISNSGFPVKEIMAQLPRNVFNRASGHQQVCVWNMAVCGLTVWLCISRHCKFVSVTVWKNVGKHCRLLCVSDFAQLAGGSNLSV